MAFAGTGKIWMNGAMVDWKDATIHVASHVIHYGTGAFEGLRAYDSKTGTNVFRLEPHMRRMIDSCRVYRMEPKWSQQELEQVVLPAAQRHGVAGECLLVRLVDGLAQPDPARVPVLHDDRRRPVQLECQEPGCGEVAEVVN